MKMAEVVQIERPAPRLRICPVCKQPTHLGCDHAVVEFQAEQREKQRQANRASYEKKSNENKDRRNPTTVENIEEIPSEAAADESEQNDLYDHARILWERMTPETRERFLARCAAARD
jgi:catalase